MTTPTTTPDYDSAYEDYENGAAASYTTRADAAQAAREALPDASAALVDLVTDETWRGQISVGEAVERLSRRGIDCEGYDNRGSPRPAWEGCP